MVGRNLEGRVNLGPTLEVEGDSDGGGRARKRATVRERVC